MNFSYTRSHEWNNQASFFHVPGTRPAAGAGAFLHRYAGVRFEAHRAGLEPKPINPFTIQVMQEAGLDMSSHRSKGIDEYLGKVRFSGLCPCLHLCVLAQVSLTVYGQLTSTAWFSWEQHGRPGLVLQVGGAEAELQLAFLIHFHEEKQCRGKQDQHPQHEQG